MSMPLFHCLLDFKIWLFAGKTFKVLEDDCFFLIIILIVCHLYRNTLGDFGKLGIRLLFYVTFNDLKIFFDHRLLLCVFYSLFNKSRSFQIRQKQSVLGVLSDVLKDMVVLKSVRIAFY